MFKNNDSIEDLRKELNKALDELKEEPKESSIEKKIKKVEEEHLPKEALYEMLTKEECIELLEQSAQNTIKNNLTIAFLMTALKTDSVALDVTVDKYRRAATRVMSGKVPESKLINSNVLTIRL